MIELKLCPYCGGEARVHEPRGVLTHDGQVHYVIMCNEDNKCKIHPRTICFDYIEDAIKAWHNRVSDWISVEDGLPKIPVGKYGVSVLVTTFDPVYEEINPGNGCSVESMVYDLSGEFLCLVIGKKCDFILSPDEVIAWQYKPKPFVRK